ncbi:hypothetical protein GGR59_001956 [Xanthomonas arboricola]|uniref:P-loop ATPase, Sll1717 family n=1 Tax=Xanthomonas arboricola TaxID=56448 RepID=UPI001615CEDE|nr:ATP-binding protein [Xanthomonas arboricola]MBB4605711.1 hypothetical protein [Xanthomonas arboricola]
MSNIDSLVKYFKGGSAEAEREIRGQVFVQPKNFSSLLNFDFHSSVVLLGNKGIGKSILVNVIHEAFLENDELSVLISPDNLECDPILQKKTLADKKSVAYAQMLRAVAGIIGRHSSESEIAIKQEVVALQKLAVEDGYAKDHLISKFARILAGATPKGRDLAKSMLVEQGGVLTKNNLTDVISEYLASRNKNLWLFVDDIDAAVAVGSTGGFDYAACWAIVSAAIELSEDVSELKCVVSVRSDIWHLMTRVHGHGTEKRDKLGNIKELKFSEEELQSIFERRIALAVKENGSGENLTVFFRGNKITLPGRSQEKRHWSQWVAKVSRNKPRDLVKLIQALITKTKEDGADKIGDAQAHEILVGYGEDRVENIVDEYGIICPQIRDVIDDLTEKNSYEFQELVDKLRKQAAKRSMAIDGVALRQDNDSAIKILRILHMACFINPRLESEDEYVHLNYSDYPKLVDMAKFNQLQNYSWQIHPAFHSYVASVRNRDYFKESRNHR